MANFILKVTFPIIFNSIFLTLVFLYDKYSLITWIIFVNIAYCALIFVPRIIADGHKEKVLSWSIYLICWAYFVIEFAVGFIFNFLSLGNQFFAISSQYVLFGLFVVIVAATHIANKKTVQSLERQDIRNTFIKDLISEFTIIREDTTEALLKNNCNKIIERLQASPLEVNHKALEFENEIRNCTNKLRNANGAESESLCNQIIKNLSKRNSLSMK